MSFADIEVAGIGVSCEDRAAGLVDDSIVWVCGDIDEQLVDGGGSGLGGGVLMGFNCTEGYEDLVIDSSSIEEEGSDNALDSSDAGGVEGRTGWSSVGILNFCAIGRV